MPRPPRADLRARHAFAFAITALAGFAAVLAPACVLPPPVAAADQVGPPGGFGPPGGVADPPPPAVPGPPGSDGERPVVEGPGAAGALVVHLDGWGGRVHAGPRDDAGADVSNIVTEAGLAHVDVPAFEGTALEWIALEACVARAYAGLPITLVRRPPSERPYVRVIVGGSAAMLGPTDRWGVASTGPGTVVTDGVGFVFSADHQTTTRGLDLCQSVSHELGHLIGLPHTPDCRDLMSDDRSCPHEAFSELSRARLEASLRRWGEVVALPMPARVTGVVGEDPAVTGLRFWSRGIEPMPGGVPALAPAFLAFTVQAPRPVARALLRVVTPELLRGEYHCLVDGAECDVVGNQIIGRYPVTGAGQFHLLVEVTYQDGTTRTTPWISVVKS
jgi:hypothetical protein